MADEEETLKDEGKPSGFKLPEALVANSEDFYTFYSEMVMGHQMLDNDRRNDALKKYLQRFHYIVERILPQLREADRIKAFSLEEKLDYFAQTYGDNLEEGLKVLTECHRGLNQLLYGYDIMKVKLYDFTGF